MAPVSGLKILRFHSHAYFHGSATNEIHAALHDHEIAKVDRLAKINAVY
jgi:hypothetical protein